MSSAKQPASGFRRMYLVDPRYVRPSTTSTTGAAGSGEASMMMPQLEPVAPPIPSQERMLERRRTTFEREMQEVIEDPRLNEEEKLRRFLEILRRHILTTRQLDRALGERAQPPRPVQYTDEEDATATTTTNGSILSDDPAIASTSAQSPVRRRATPTAKTPPASVLPTAPAVKTPPAAAPIVKAPPAALPMDVDIAAAALPQPLPPAPVSAKPTAATAAFPLLAKPPSKSTTAQAQLEAAQAAEKAMSDFMAQAVASKPASASAAAAAMEEEDDAPVDRSGVSANEEGEYNIPHKVRKDGQSSYDNKLEPHDEHNINANIPPSRTAQLDRLLDRLKRETKLDRRFEWDKASGEITVGGRTIKGSNLTTLLQRLYVTTSDAKNKDMPPIGWKAFSDYLQRVGVRQGGSGFSRMVAAPVRWLRY